MAKKKTSSNLLELDNLSNLTVRTKVGGERKKTQGFPDAISDECAKCNSASEIAALSIKFGFTEEDVIEWGKTAPNFGQFAMRIRNRLRGVVSRIERAKKQGVTLTLQDAAYPKAAKVKRGVKQDSTKSDEAPETEKPVKAPSEKKIRKTRKTKKRDEVKTGFVD